MDVGLVMIIAWILGALQGVLLGELIRALLTYVKLRARERIRRCKIMSSSGPRAPWVCPIGGVARALHGVASAGRSSSGS